MWLHVFLPQGREKSHRKSHTRIRVENRKNPKSHPAPERLEMCPRKVLQCACHYVGKDLKMIMEFCQYRTADYVTPERRGGEL